MYEMTEMKVVRDGTIWQAISLDTSSACYLYLALLWTYLPTTC